MWVRQLPVVVLVTAVRKARATSSGGFENAPHPAAETTSWLHALCFAASRIALHNWTRDSYRPGVFLACPSLLKWKAAADKT